LQDLLSSLVCEPWRTANYSDAFAHGNANTCTDPSTHAHAYDAAHGAIHCVATDLGELGTQHMDHWLLGLLQAELLLAGQR